MTTTATHAPTRAVRTTRQRVGIVVGGIYALTNVPSVLFPSDTGPAGDGPPMAILVVCSVLAVFGTVAAVLAWRGSGVATRILAGSITVITITSLPAFFVDVPMGLKALVGAGVLVTVLAVVLMLSGPRRAEA